MAGILNKKERMLDMIVTHEGRRQATQGQLKIAYASFTDMHTFYRASGSFDTAEAADDRIFFEATNRIQDVVVPELEPGNSLRPFRAGDFFVDGHTMASGSFKVGFIDRPNVLTGSQIKDADSSLLDSLANHFQDQRILRTSDPFSDTSDLILSTNSLKFALKRDTLFGRVPVGTQVIKGKPHQPSRANIDSAPSLFMDKRFAHFPNFDFLPPVNLPPPEREIGDPLGDYLNLGEPADQTYEDIKEDLASRNRSVKNIEFIDTSRDNNLVCQIFEFSSDGVEKLSIVDAGEFEDGDPISPGKQVYYVGKILKDTSGTETFFNIFTVVFD